ncbi:hypothetical protein B0A54_17520 [Friedmanniomyces endolithicus]|uniref:Uncharacterized protein n=1 Tax=Friedmanniomyces endolithicus TaxID=329885 RepID=A0A4U0TW73_9PEZI|nr:hypothetical protein B0A54_17520 [Friedmanniomyces endolithicus]
MAESTARNDEAFSYNKTVKKGWGDWPNFLTSYGLKQTPEGFEEGRQILGTMLKAEKDAEKSTHEQSSGYMARE